MKCMLVAAASIDRMQQAMRPTHKGVDTGVAAGDGGPCAKAGMVAGGSGTAAEGRVMKEPMVAERGLHWGLLDQAMLSTMQLRLRTYHHVLHENAPEVWPHACVSYMARTVSMLW